MKNNTLTHNILGNLMDWGPVIDKLEELRERRELDDHQTDLIRILRDRSNWRLRETALNCVKVMSHPCDELLRTVLAIMMDEDIYGEASTLAAEVLAAVFARHRNGEAQSETVHEAALVVEEMRDLLRRPDPTAFHKTERRNPPSFQGSTLGASPRNRRASLETAGAAR